MRPHPTRWTAGAAVVALAAAGLPTLWTGLSRTGADPASFVDPFIGTGPPPTQTGTTGFDTTGPLGETFPGPSLPFGMLQWSPHANADRNPFASYIYGTGVTELTGFSLLHNDGEQFRYVPFLPLTGPVTTSPAVDPAQYHARFDHQGEEASPGYYRVDLQSGVRVELTATERGGLARFSFPRGSSAALLLSLSDTGKAGSDQITVDPTARTVSGYSTADGVRVFFVADFDRPITSFGTYQGAGVHPGTASATGPATGGWIGFGPSTGTVEAHVAVSYVGLAGAAANLETEIEGPHLDFETAVRRARATWDQLLGRFAVGSTPMATRRTFMTALLPQPAPTQPGQ